MTEDDDPSHKENVKEKVNKKAWLGGIGLLSLLALKYKAFIFGAFSALKGLSFLKAFSIFKGFSSLFISLGLYTAIYGWKFAITLILLLYIHEMGHYLYMKKEGLHPDAPVFVPFLGAYVAMKNLPDNKATHAWVGYSGPFVGGMAAAAFYYIGLQTDNDFLVAAASLGFFLNLLQLLPVKPFDGGFVVECVSKWFLIPGTLLLIAVTIYLHSFLLMILCAFSIYRVYKLFKEEGIKERVSSNPLADEHIKEKDHPYASVFPELSQRRDSTTPIAGHEQAPPFALVQKEATLSERITISAAYIILAGCLACLYWHSHNYMAGIHNALK
jgi:Zn-dependent protease